MLLVRKSCGYKVCLHVLVLLLRRKCVQRKSFSIFLGKSNFIENSIFFISHILMKIIFNIEKNVSSKAKPSLLFDVSAFTRK